MTLTRQAELLLPEDAWIQTYTGRVVRPLALEPEDVCIEDIARALSALCRFAGHSKVWYSVAEHSVRVSRIVPAADALWGLVHDASEAYGLVDMPSPVKRTVGFGEVYCYYEKLAMDAVCRHFGLPLEMPESVHRADKILLATEQRDLMGRPPKPWSDAAEPLPERIEPMRPEEAEQVFLGRFKQLVQGQR